MTDQEAPVNDTPQPTVPHVDEAPQTFADAEALGRAFAEFRAEVAQLRKELAASRQPQKFQAAVTETLVERTNRRVLEIANHSHYCPGCGRLYNYPQQCRGSVEAPHLPNEVVSTSELAGDPALHTAAPNTDVLAA